MKGNVFFRMAIVTFFSLLAWNLPAETINSLPRINAPVEQEEQPLPSVEHSLFEKYSFAGLAGGFHTKNSAPEAENVLGQAIFQADSKHLQIFVGLQLQYQQAYLTTQLEIRPFTFEHLRLALVLIGNMDFYDLSTLDTCHLSGISLEFRPNNTVFFQTSGLFILNYLTLCELSDRKDYVHPEHAIAARLSMCVNLPKTTLTFMATTYERFLYRSYENQSYIAEISFTPFKPIQMTLTATVRMHGLFSLTPTYDETDLIFAIKYLF